MTVNSSKKFPVVLLAAACLLGFGGPSRAQDNVVVVGDGCLDSRTITPPLGETVGGREAQAFKRIFGLEGDPKVAVRMITSPTGIINITVTDANNCLVAADTLTYGEYDTLMGVRTILDEHYRQAEENRLTTEVPADPQKSGDAAERDRHAAQR